MYQYIKNFTAVCYLIIFLITGFFFLKLDFQGNKKNKSNDYTQPSLITTKLVEISQLFRSMNSYGLFRVMTDTRPEIIISYSDDGKSWEPYRFRYKPVKTNNRPQFFPPHMPRLDWQLWFEGLYIERIMQSPISLDLYKRFLEVVISSDIKLGKLKLENFFTKNELSEINSLDQKYKEAYLKNCQFYLNNYINHSYWFGMFLRGLKKGNLDILNLLSKNDIGINSPNWLRVELYHYTFSDRKEKKKGYWWKREKLEEFELNISLGKKYDN